MSQNQWCRDSKILQFFLTVIIVKNQKKLNNTKFHNDDFSRNTLHSVFESGHHCFLLIKVFIRINFTLLGFILTFILIVEVGDIVIFHDILVF